MQKEQGTMTIGDNRQKMPQYVNQEYRDKMVSMGNKYFQKMHRELLKEYKEQLLENIKKFQNPETITREEFLTSMNFVDEVNSAIEELELYYEGTRVRTVKSDISNIREIIHLYQDVYGLEQEFFEVIFNKGKSSKIEEMVAYNRIQRSVDQLQNHLMEKGILVSEIEEPTNEIVVTEGEVTQYKETLGKILEMIQNLKDATVLDILTMIQDYFEIEDRKDALDSLYQHTEDMSVRVNILYILDALEKCEKVLPLASYFDKMNLDTKIGDYLNSVSSKEKETIEEEILKIQSSSKETEDDYDENKLLDFHSVLEDVNIKLDQIQNESIDDVMESLENDGIIPITETLEIKEESPKDVKVSFMEKRRLRREARKKIRVHSKNLKLARKEYLTQIKNLQGQLDHNLKCGVTFMFVKEYRDNYYQDKLNSIKKRIEKKYGSVISRQLKNDSKIQMGRKRIISTMKHLREGFEELLNTEVEKSDGTITSLLEIQNLSEAQFQLMMETVPVLVDAIEENMRSIRIGGSVKPIEHASMDIEFEYLEEDPIQIEEDLTFEEAAQEEIFEEVAYEEEATEDDMYEELGFEYPYVKPTRALIRNSNYHYDTCKILLGFEKRNLRGDEFEQICHRLSKELKDKKKLMNDDGRLWYTYKCSVEEINHNIRRLRFARAADVNSIIENIHKESQDFVTYFEAYQERNHKTLKEKIENLYTSTLEDIREILSGEEYEEYEEANKFENPDYNLDLDLEFMNIDAEDEKPLLERVEAQEVAYTPRDLKELDVIPVVRNLSFDEEIVEQGTYRMNESAKGKTPIVILGVQNDNTYTPLIDLAAIEAQIRFLAQQESTEDDEIYQKAIS